MQKNAKMQVLNYTCLAIFCSPGYSFLRWKIFTITHQVQSLQRSHIFIFFFVASEHIHDSSLLHSLQKRNIFITFSSFCCWKFLLFLIEGSLCQWPHRLNISYIDDNYFGDNNNSPVWYLYNMCLAVSSHLLHRWSFQTYAVSDSDDQIVLIRNSQLCLQTVPQTQNSNRKVLEKLLSSVYSTLKYNYTHAIFLPSLQCQRLKLGQVMWRRPPKNGTLLFNCGLDHFSREGEFQPKGVVELQSWHQGIHIAKVDLSSNRCFRCWRRQRWKSHHAL